MVHSECLRFACLKYDLCIFEQRDIFGLCILYIAKKRENNYRIPEQVEVGIHFLSRLVSFVAARSKAYYLCTEQVEQ
jgi:hypothetical protein